MNTSQRPRVWRTALIGGVLTLLVGYGSAATASVGSTIYVPEPTIDVSVHKPVCDGDVPYLEYQVDVTDTPNTTVDITWDNPSGPDVVQSGRPLSGRVLWPGAVVDGAGMPLDWPGWTKVGDDWVVGDEFDWVREGVQVTFEVNPAQTVTVSYPPSSPQCLTNPPQTPAPTMTVRTLTPTCVDGVAYLDYAVDVTGTPNTTATLTWHNPDGNDVVQTGQPLSGRVLWPGAYPERFVALAASDGWELVNNMWMNTADYGWAIGTVDLTFAVNPERTVAVAFPPAENCAAIQPASADSAGSAGSDDAGSLARTGAMIGLYAGIAVALVGIGWLALYLSRRNRQGSTH